jgi:hypothetical protein
MIRTRKGFTSHAPLVLLGVFGLLITNNLFITGEGPELEWPLHLLRLETLAEKAPRDFIYFRCSSDEQQLFFVDPREHTHRGSA